MMKRILTLRNLLLLGGSLLGAASSTQTTYGQMEFMTEAMNPEYFARDLVLFSERLNLDDNQEVIVEAMFDTYSDDFAAGWAATQDRINTIAIELRENKTASVRDTLKPVLETLGAWLDEKRALDLGLLENVKTILIDEQLELWPLFSQKLYREKHINRGRLSGESTDLFQVVRDTNLSGTAESVITPHLEEYAIAMDVSMRKRDSILRGNPKKKFESILSGDAFGSPQHKEVAVNARIKENKAVVKARINVRDINDRYIDVISSSLHPEDGENFRQRALSRGYPRVFRRTPAQKILRQAAENESYEPEIHALIIQLEYAYLGELELINFDLLRLTRIHDPEVMRNRALAELARHKGQTPTKLENPTRALYKKREELGRRYIEMLRDILSPEAFLELEGARRWVPREEQSFTPLDIKPTSSSGLGGGFQLKGSPNNKGNNQGRSKGRPKPRPDPSGIGSDKSERGSGSSGGS